jgi:hypothetical protein
VTALDDNLWRVEGSLESMPLKRVMAIARRADGQLVVHGAVALEEPAMKEIEALGPVGYLVVPNGFHRLDAPAYKLRYPAAKVVCPKGSRKKVEEVVPVDFVYDDFPADAAVSFVTLEGIRSAEGVMVVRSPGGTSLVFTDALFNMPHLDGLEGFLLKHVTQSTGPLHVSRVFRLLVLKDKAAFRADLERLSKIGDLRRIVVAHHETVEDEPARFLAEAAAKV